MAIYGKVAAQANKYADFGRYMLKIAVFIAVQSDLLF